MSRERVVVEVNAGGTRWAPMPTTPSPNGPPGALPDYSQSDPQIYIFGWANDQGPGLWRTRPGFTTDGLGDSGEGAVISTAGFDTIADLTAGPVTISIVDSDGHHSKLRFTYQPATESAAG